MTRYKRPRGKNEYGYRSYLEKDIADIISDVNGAVQFEVTKLDYVYPESHHSYTVDFTLPNGILLETKGYFRDIEERRKYELIRSQHRHIDLRFIFDNPSKLIRKNSKTTYADWATKHGFKWCGKHDREQIINWIKE